MNWMMKPVLIIGNGPVSDLLVEKLIEKYAYIYFWDPFENEIPKYEEIKAVRKKLEEIDGGEMFLRSPTSIFYIVSNGILKEKNEYALNILNRVFEETSDRRTRFVMGTYFNDYRGEEIVKEIYKLMEKNGRGYKTLIDLGEIYGERVKEGIVFKILCKFKEECPNITLPISPREKRSYIHIEDAVDALIKTAEKAEGIGIYSVKGSIVENRRIVNRIIRLLGIEAVCNIKFTKGEKEKKNLKANYLSWFKPRIKLREGLERTVGWFESEYGPILVCPNHHLKFDD